MWSRLGRKGLVLGLAMGLLAGVALAAQNEVRLPVEKSVRLAPPQETPAAKATEAQAAKATEAQAAEAKSERKPEPVAKAPVPEAKPAEAKAVAARPAAKPKAVAPAAEADTAPVAEAAPKIPAPKPAPKPRPEPVIDPLAAQTPAQPAREAVALPEDGQFVGEVELEFLPDRIILRAAANGPVERVTHFGLPSPRKLALDMRGSWRKKGASVLRFDTGPVKAVVTGHHPDRLRLAVEFRQGAVAPDMQPVVELGPRGFTATIPLAVRLTP